MLSFQRATATVTKIATTIKFATSRYHQYVNEASSQLALLQRPLLSLGCDRDCTGERQTCIMVQYALFQNLHVEAVHHPSKCQKSVTDIKRSTHLSVKIVEPKP